MECPNCQETIESNAAYCGNCGQALGNKLGVISVQATAPGYEVALSKRHGGEMQALASLLCGAIGLAGTLFIPLAGLALGISGIVLGTLSRNYAKKTTHIIGLVLSILALLAGLAAWTYAIRSDPRVNPSVTRAEPSEQDVKVSDSLTTPCYSIGLVDELNISNQTNSCDMKAFNGSTLAGSTNAYKIYASKADVNSANDFTNLAKTAINKDIAQSVPSFRVTNEQVTSFAGSPAYSVTATSPDNKVSLIEAAVFHKTSDGNNVFILVHANSGPDVDLQLMESRWQWK